MSNPNCLLNKHTKHTLKKKLSVKEAVVGVIFVSKDMFPWDSTKSRIS